MMGLLRSHLSDMLMCPMESLCMMSSKRFSEEKWEFTDSFLLLFMYLFINFRSLDDSVIVLLKSHCSVWTAS